MNQLEGLPLGCTPPLRKTLPLEQNATPGADLPSSNFKIGKLNTPTSWVLIVDRPYECLSLYNPWFLSKKSLCGNSFLRFDSKNAQIKKKRPSIFVLFNFKQLLLYGYPSKNASKYPNIAIFKIDIFHPSYVYVFYMPPRQFFYQNKLWASS